MKILRSCLLFLLLLVSLPSLTQAQVISLCDTRLACTSSPSATVGVDSRVNLTWRGQARTSGEMAQTLISDQGTFMLGHPVSGKRLGVSPNPLMQPIEPATDDSGIEFRVTESLHVPAAISQQAAQLGEQQVFYVRRFSLEGSKPETGVQVITLQQGVPGRDGATPEGAEPSASGVAIQRVSLFFDGGTLSETVRPNALLKATARIRYRGTGLLNAVWEAATPASTRGEPIYVPLEMVRQYISGRELVLTSPQLPTDTAGLHRLRLRFLPPTVIDELPVLSYRVSDTALQRQSEVPVIRLWPIESTSPVSRNTRFRWQPVPESHAYQLEFYAERPVELPLGGFPGAARMQPVDLGRPPVTGQLMNGQQREASPSVTVLSHLQPGQLYFWRVVAIDIDGQVLAASQIEPIRP